LQSWHKEKAGLRHLHHCLKKVTDNSIGITSFIAPNFATRPSILG